MERYLMYLRKSRMDTDYEEISITETLSRHRITLEKLCKSKRLHVDEVLEEVVSGESLAARPQMMRLLEMVSTGAYAGVVCMDIERLSRGSSMESGYIMQILQVNGCKIVTPGKIYDLQNESDEQFTDMKFMFSRYELKTITKRLVRGRNQSASEGKFMGSMAPYGYRAYKLPGEKGVYTIDMFTKRNTSLSKEIKQLQIAEGDLMRQQSEQSQKEQQVAQIIPTTQHILESYPLLEIEEKNRLWKLVLKRVTVYRSPDDKLEVNIYPNLPK